MRIDKIRKKRKKEWTENYLFGDLCFWYLEKHPRQINKLEKILFLMHYESLETYGVPLLVYKTYIDGNIIYLKHLSELLRLSEPEAVYDSNRIDEKVKQYHYDKMLKKYEKQNEEDLNNEIERLIDTKSLDREYFLFERPSYENELKKVRLNCHSFHFIIVQLFGLMSVAMILTLFVEFLSYYGYAMADYSSESVMQSLFFGILSIGLFLNSYIRGTRKVTQYEKTYQLLPTSLVENRDNRDEGLSYDDTITIQTTILKVDEHIQTIQDIYKIESMIFNDICEMIKNCAKKYPNVHYVVTLERLKNLELDSEDLPRYYTSQVFVYLTRNHVILEREKDAGEWPGASSEILKVKKNKVFINENYKADILENIEWCSQVYLGDKESYYENKDESDQFIRDSAFIMWIDE